MDFSDHILALGLLGTMALLAGSAFISACEASLTIISKTDLETLSRGEDVKARRRAKRLLRILSRRERFNGALVLGGTLLNVAATLWTTLLLVNAFGWQGILLSLLIMPLAVALFGEFIPKTLAHHRPLSVAIRASGPVAGFVLVLSPLVAALEWVTRKIFARMNNEDAVDRAMRALRGAIDVHAGQTDTIEERKMLRSILDLGDVTVFDVMTHRKNMLALDADMGNEALIDAIMESTFSRVPLWRDNADNIIGVIHTKDVMKALRQTPDLSRFDITDLMTKPWFIPDTTTLLEQLQAFKARGQHFALVVDEYGALLGIITLEDILEEIVGDIADEHDDVAVIGVRPQSNGTLLVDGTVTLRDLNRQFDWQLPDDQATTLAGLLLYEARRIPEVGQSFMFHGFRFQVLIRKRNQINTIRVTPPATRRGK